MSDIDPAVRRLDQTTDEFEAAEVRLGVRSEALRGSRNPITKVFHRMRVARARAEVARLHTKGEIAEENYLYKLSH